MELCETLSRSPNAFFLLPFPPFFGYYKGPFFSGHGGKKTFFDREMCGLNVQPGKRGGEEGAAAHSYFPLISSRKKILFHR